MHAATAERKRQTRLKYCATQDAWQGDGFFIAQPEIFPAVILWDEYDSGKSRSGGTRQTIIRTNVLSAMIQTR